MMMDHYLILPTFLFEILHNDFRYTFLRKEERIITGCHFKGLGWNMARDKNRSPLRLMRSTGRTVLSNQ